MTVLGDHRVAELLVKAEIAGKLAPDADSDLPVTLRAGVLQGPRHQRRPDALALPDRIDGDAPHMQGAGLAIEPQAADRLHIEERQSAAGSLEIFADRFLGFPERTARRVERAIFAKGQLGQPVNDGCVGRLAETDLKTYQFDSISISPFRRARRSAQLKTRCATMSVATVVITSRDITSASDSVGNIRMASEPSKLRRISSIQ